MQLKIGDWLRKYLDKTLGENQTTTLVYPPPIAKTIGFELVEIGEASATLKMQTDPAIHANPLGTVHGGVLYDLADAAMGTAHGTTLAENESFTSIDLRINFFRPLWKDQILARAKAIQLGKTVSFYSCDIHTLGRKTRCRRQRLHHDSSKGRSEGAVSLLRRRMTQGGLIRNEGVSRLFTT
jgi:uncharacterized protein (TIGR00369 family)